MDEVENLDDATLESYRVVYEYLKNPPQTKRDLYIFLTALTGEHIPWQSTCANHKTPFDYIWMSYRVDLPKWKDDPTTGMVYMGPRGGYKTLSVAKLIMAELLLKPDCHIVGIGAIENHTKVTYQYVQRYLQHPLIRELKLVTKLNMSETVLRNGSTYAQSCATISGVNALHPQKMRLEEMDAGWKPQIIEDAKMVQSSRSGLRPHTSYVSSRKYEGGIMDDLVEGAPEAKMDSVVCCYKDVAEPCPVERRGRTERMYMVEDIFNPGESVPVNAFEHCGTCPLLPTCRGDLARARGLVKIDDLIRLWHNLETETWIFQMECRKAKATDLFFPEWVEALHMGNYPYNPTIGWVDFSFDFTGGGEDPTVIGVWQTDGDLNDYLIKEFVFRHKSTGSCAQEVEKWVADTGIKSIRRQFGDSAAMQSITDWNATNSKLFKIEPVRKIERRQGWPILRQRIRDSDGHRHLFVDRGCKQFLKEVKDARRRRDDPSDIRDRCSDHSLDQARYRFVQLLWKPQKEARIRIMTAPDDDIPHRPIFLSDTPVQNPAPKADASGPEPSKEVELGGLNRVLVGSNDGSH